MRSLICLLLTGCIIDGDGFLRFTTDGPPPGCDIYTPDDWVAVARDPDGNDVWMSLEVQQWRWETDACAWVGEARLGLTHEGVTAEAAGTIYSGPTSDMGEFHGVASYLEVENCPSCYRGDVYTDFGTAFDFGPRTGGWVAVGDRLVLEW